MLQNAAIDATHGTTIITTFQVPDKSTIASTHTTGAFAFYIFPVRKLKNVYLTDMLSVLVFPYLSLYTAFKTAYSSTNNPTNSTTFVATIATTDGATK